MAAVLVAVKTYGELVRDRIPEIIEQVGKSATLEKANAREFRVTLRAKILEEAKELMDVADDALLSELADLAEVIEAILCAYNLTRDELEATQRRKNDQRGAFTRRLFLESVSE